MADQSTWNERYRAKDLLWSAGPNRLFADVVAEIPAGSALDLGCGEGRNAVYLAERGWEVLGIDYAEAGIDKARRIASKRGVSATFSVADAATYEPPVASFDLVAIIFLHTDPETRAAWLPRSLAAVAPGGRWLWIGHDPDNIERGVGGPKDSSVLPSVDTLVSALPADFEVLEARQVERSVDSDPGHGASGPGIAIDNLVVARR